MTENKQSSGTSSTLQNPSSLAVETAETATNIAKNIALLGTENTDAQALSMQIFEDSLKQIRRIQKLYNLPDLNLSYKLPPQ